jgi:hypothetical protein
MSLDETLRTRAPDYQRPATGIGRADARSPNTAANGLPGLVPGPLPHDRAATRRRWASPPLGQRQSAPATTGRRRLRDHRATIRNNLTPVKFTRADPATPPRRSIAPSQEASRSRTVTLPVGATGVGGCRGAMGIPSGGQSVGGSGDALSRRVTAQSCRHLGVGGSATLAPTSQLRNRSGGFR